MRSATHQRVIDAYHAEEFASQAKRITLRASANGFAFRMKWQHPIVRRYAVVGVQEPGVWLASEFPGDPMRVFVRDEVRLENTQGHVIEERQNPRQYFPGGRRMLWWDSLDQTYFSGYALWNYVAFPALLLRSDIEWSELTRGTLQARFDSSVPTHSRVQQFHFNTETWLLRQHDYTADIIGSWAHAANVVLEHAVFDGFPFAVHRRVTPRRKDGTPRSGPVLVEIKLDEIAVERD